MKNTAIILFLISFLSIISLAQTPPADPISKIPSIVPVDTSAKPKPETNAVTKEKTYTNKTYDFQITFPENWVIPENYLNENIEAQGYQLHAAPGAGLKTSSKFVEDIDRVKVLLTAYRTGARNKTMIRVSVEDLSPLPQIKDAVDYFDAMRESFKAMKLPADFKFSETQAEKLGKKQFAFLDTSSNTGKKRMYATVRGGYAIMFTLTYKTDEDLQTFRQILAGGNFASGQ